MGFLKFLKVAGTPEGIREAIRESYRKHRELASAKSIEDPHSAGLYGALATRYRLLRRTMQEVEIWADLAPFLGMPELESVEALSEYVVHQEWPRAANLELLRRTINRSLTMDGEHLLLAEAGIRNQAPWVFLLSPETARRIHSPSRSTDQTNATRLTDAPLGVSDHLSQAIRHLNRGSVLASEGRSEDALREFDLAVSLNPALEEAWFNKGNTLGYLGRAEEALLCYEHAPNLAQAWCNMGVILRRRGRNERALECYMAALHLNPNEKISWLNKGVVQSILFDAQGALASYDRALSLDDAYGEAWVNKSGFLAQIGRYDEARMCLDRGLSLNPSDSIAWIFKGDILDDQGLSQEALLCYERAVQVDHNLEQAWIRKGICCRKLSRLRSAIEAFDKAISLNPQNSEGWLNKGLALMDEHDYGYAKECLEQAQFLGSDKVEELVHLCNKHLTGE